MINNLQFKSFFICASLAGIGFLAVTAVPSPAHLNDGAKENSSFYLTQTANTSNQNHFSNFPVDNNEQKIFKKSPYLIAARTTDNKKNSSFATYYFTIKIPSDAGGSLKAIKIEQRKNFSDKIIFKTKENRVFLGQQIAEKEPLSLTKFEGEEAGESVGTVTVILSKSVAPDNILTVAIKPKRNPRMGGVYLFGVTAYPEGENSRGLYLGVGRLHISHN